MTIVLSAASSSFSLSSDQGNQEKKLSIECLHWADVEAKFHTSLQSKLVEAPYTDKSPDTLWDHLKSALLKISDKVDYAKKKNKDCFDENNRNPGPSSNEEGSTSGPPGSSPLSFEESYIP